MYSFPTKLLFSLFIHSYFTLIIGCYSLNYIGNHIPQKLIWQS